MENDLKKKGTLKKLWAAHGKFLKWASIGGLLLTCAFLPSAAVAAQAALGTTKTASLLDVGKQFYSTAFNKAADNLIPGWGVILKGTFNTVASVVTPIVGLITPGIGGPTL